MYFSIAACRIDAINSLVLLPLNSHFLTCEPIDDSLGSRSSYKEIEVCSKPNSQPDNLALVVYFTLRICVYFREVSFVSFAVPPNKWKKQPMRECGRGTSLPRRVSSAMTGSPRMASHNLMANNGPSLLE